LPRKYRPPESRRRKSSKTASPHIFEQPLEDGDVSAAALDDAVPVDKAATAHVIAERRSAAQSSRTTAVKHISRDYGYVRGEIGRIVLVAGFLIVSLIITALLRN
jgi:hypothetical protein